MHEPDVVILKLNKEKLLLMRLASEFGMNYENETNVAIHRHNCLH